MHEFLMFLPVLALFAAGIAMLPNQASPVFAGNCATSRRSMRYGDGLPGRCYMTATKSGSGSAKAKKKSNVESSVPVFGDTVWDHVAFYDVDPAKNTRPESFGNPDRDKDFDLPRKLIANPIRVAENVVSAWLKRELVEVKVLNANERKAAKARRDARINAYEAETVILDSKGKVILPGSAVAAVLKGWAEIAPEPLYQVQMCNRRLTAAPMAVALRENGNLVPQWSRDGQKDTWTAQDNFDYFIPVTLVDPKASAADRFLAHVLENTAKDAGRVEYTVAEECLIAMEAQARGIAATRGDFERILNLSAFAAQKAIAFTDLNRIYGDWKLKQRLLANLNPETTLKYGDDKRPVFVPNGPIDYKHINKEELRKFAKAVNDGETRTQEEFEALLSKSYSGQKSASAMRNPDFIKFAKCRNDAVRAVVGAQQRDDATALHMMNDEGLCVEITAAFRKWGYAVDANDGRLLPIQAETE